MVEGSPTPAEGVLPADGLATLIDDACSALGLVHLSLPAVLAAAEAAAEAEAAGTLDDTAEGQTPNEARLAAKATLAEQGEEGGEGGGGISFH